MQFQYHWALVKPLHHYTLLPLMGIEPRIGNCLIYLLLTSSPDTCLNLRVLF